MRDLLIEAVPDLVALVRPDGTILDHIGGHRSFRAGKAGTLRGERLDSVWSEPVARAIRQMIRGVLATREPAEAHFREGDNSVEIRVRAHGRQRALLVVRDAGGQDPSALREASAPAVALRIERRGFLRRFRLSIADACLRERPLAVCMIHLGGLHAIGQALGFAVAEKVSTLALERLRDSVAAEAPTACWHVGQLGDGLLAGVIDGVHEAEAVRGLVSGWCAALAQELLLGDAVFTVTPHAGIAFLGPEATRPQALLERARAAMHEARRVGAERVGCYSDGSTLQPRPGPTAGRELHEAIEAGQLTLAYAARQSLATGRLVALQVELRWRHPDRGELRGPQFLPLAQQMGLVATLGRWVFARVAQDLPALVRAVGPQPRVSVVAAPQHLESPGFEDELVALLAAESVSTGGLELRVAERTVAGLAEARRRLQRLAGLGPQLVMHEFGRAYSSLARLSELPLAGLQLDRRIVARLGDDARARAVCEAATGVARALGLASSAEGVDASRPERVDALQRGHSGPGQRAGTVRRMDSVLQDTGSLSILPAELPASITLPFPRCRTCASVLCGRP
jgi:EAL domain-containing protein (putative c-di-GMP-specific phosphodiesterase class I)/GGDEF domain-containing protein